MIQARHHILYDFFFNRYIHHILKKDFQAIEVVGGWPEGPESVLVIGNHVSWWDGFWVYYLNKRLLNKRLHVMMLEEQLKPRAFLSRIGGFSINPGHRSVIQSLTYASERLQEPGNLVVVYPQGEIATFSAGVIPFQKGVEQIVKKARLKQVLFYVALVDYFSQRKPTLTFYLGTDNVEAGSPVNPEIAFRLFYEASLQKQAARKS